MTRRRVNVEAEFYPNCIDDADVGLSTAERVVSCEAIEMTKDELIAKQQLEMEDLKEIIREYEEVCRVARSNLNHAEQWSIKCADFPRVAMTAIVNARNKIDSI